MESERGGGVTSRHSPSCATDKTLLHASTSDSRAVISGSSRRQRVSEVSPLRMSTPTVGPRRMRMRMRGRNAKQPLLLIHRHGNKMSGDTGGLKCACVRQKNVCSHLSRLNCGSSNLHRAPLTPDLHVLLVRRLLSSVSSCKRDQEGRPGTLPPLAPAAPGAHAPTSIFIRRHVTPQARSTSLSFFQTDVPAPLFPFLTRDTAARRGALHCGC